MAPARYHSAFNPLVEHAVELASQWHDGTYRKSRWRDEPFLEGTGPGTGVPVIAHLANVALLVQRAGWDDVTVAAAYLHDVLEDANRSGEHFDYDRLVRLIGEEVAILVLAVTEQKFDRTGEERPWRDRKEDYIRGLRAASPGSMAISLADKLHNLWTMNQALARGVDVFTPGEGRRALNAGPAEQRWFLHAVLEVAEMHADLRLDPLAEALCEEVGRFEALTGLTG